MFIKTKDPQLPINRLEAPMLESDDVWTYDPTDSECPICLEDMDPTAEDTLIALKDCGHIYHKRCVYTEDERAISGQETCAYCTRPIRWYHVIDDDFLHTTYQDDWKDASTLTSYNTIFSRKITGLLVRFCEDLKALLQEMDDIPTNAETSRNVTVMEDSFSLHSIRTLTGHTITLAPHDGSFTLLCQWRSRTQSTLIKLQLRAQCDGNARIKELLFNGKLDGSVFRNGESSTFKTSRRRGMFSRIFSWFK